MGTGIEFAKSVDNESSKYWLSVLNELKNRGVKDILIICADGLIAIQQIIANSRRNGTSLHSPAE